MNQLAEALRSLYKRILRHLHLLQAWWAARQSGLAEPRRRRSLSDWFFRKHFVERPALVDEGRITEKLVARAEQSKRDADGARERAATIRKEAEESLSELRKADWEAGHREKLDSLETRLQSINDELPAEAQPQASKPGDSQ